MADSLELELVSPERLLLSQSVAMAVVPGSEGDLGILPGHSPLISSVRPGMIAVYEGANVSQRIFVAGGFVEVSPTRCTVLAEGAVPVDDIDRPALEQQIRDLREDVAQAADENELRAAEHALAIAEVKLHVVEQPPY